MWFVKGFFDVVKVALLIFSLLVVFCVIKENPQILGWFCLGGIILAIVGHFMDCYEKSTDKYKFEHTDKGACLKDVMSHWESEMYISNQIMEIHKELDTDKYHHFGALEYKKQSEKYNNAKILYLEAKKEYDDAFLAWKNRK